VCEETARELERAKKRRDEVAKYILENHGQSCSAEWEWRDLKDRIASLEFKLDWEFKHDRCAVERSE